MNIRKYICLAVTVCASLHGFARSDVNKEDFTQSDRPGDIYKSVILGLEYEVNAGVNIGGASPMPLPAEIRQINSYSPHLNLQIGTTVTKWFGQDKKWGVASGFRFETKGMETNANVKNYGMEIILITASIPLGDKGMFRSLP